MSTIVMPVLHKGDKIAIVAPAGSVKKEQILQNLALIEKQNWIPIFAKNVFEEYNFGYNYAGTVEERIADFQWALDEEDCKIIWCVRGGYGGVQLIDSLDFTRFKKNPKWIIGYSDNTVFHQYLSLHRIPSIHGCVLKPLPQGHSKKSWESIIEILKGKEISCQIKTHKYNNIGEAKGILTGGNLSIIYSLMGSKTLDNFTDKILFIEDWYENWYHLDRMLICLERADVFSKIKGIIVGGFTKMDDKSQKKYENSFDDTSYQIIDLRLKKYSFPKVFGFPAGHIYDNRALIMGREIFVNVGTQTSIMYTE